MFWLNKTRLPGKLNCYLRYCSLRSPVQERLPDLYGKHGNSGENSNGTVHPGGNFPEKAIITFLSITCITFFPFLPKRPKFSAPFVLITSARPHFERKRKIYRYFVNDTTQSRSCLRCQKNTSTIWRKFFTEISAQKVSAPHLKVNRPRLPFLM